MLNRMKGVSLATFMMMGGLLLFTSCEQSTNIEIEESFETVKEVTPIAGAQNSKMDLQRGDEVDSYFTVSLNDGSIREAWCIEWNEDASIGVNEGTELYSTRGQEAWKELNYFMSIKDQLRAEDPDLTYLEIQVAIWSLIEKPSFDVDKISEYENVSERIYKDGEPLFDVQKVKDIVARVEEDVQLNKSKGLWDYFVIFIKSKGQTIMVEHETAFAYNEDFSTCFTDFEELRSRRWGWSNGGLEEGNYEFDMYAGAGRCDISKGTLVGKLYVDYSDGTAEVTFDMADDSPYTMTSTHLYVGSEPLPKWKWFYTVAPGLYGHTDYHYGAVDKTYTIEDLSGPIYVIGHADVFGFEVD